MDLYVLARAGRGSGWTARPVIPVEDLRVELDD